MLRRIAAVAAAAATLLWVALYNGYPLVWWDSGAYLESSFLRAVPVSRPVFYGLFLRLTGSAYTLWSVVAAQALLVVYLARRVLVVCLPESESDVDIDRALVLITAVLAVITALPWIVGEVMPDLFAGVAVLALFLTIRADRLAGHVVLASLVLVLSLVVHFTHIPLAVGLVALAAVARRAGWTVARAGVRRAAGCILVAVVLIPVTNWTLTGRWFFSDAAPNMMLDRFLSEGIAQKLLAERCPEAGYALCAYQSDLPQSPGRYLWDPQSPFTRVGGWAHSGPEASRLVRDSMRAYPGLVLRRTAEAFVSQLTRFNTFSDPERFGAGTGINYEMTLRLPREYSRYLHSRQQAGVLADAAFRELHWWIAVTCLLAAAFLCVATRRTRPDQALFLLLCVSAVPVNAAVIAAAGSPDDRYAARVIWLSVFAVLLSLADSLGSYLSESPRRS